MYGIGMNEVIQDMNWIKINNNMSKLSKVLSLIQQSIVHVDLWKCLILIIRSFILKIKKNKTAKTTTTAFVFEVSHTDNENILFFSVYQDSQNKSFRICFASCLTYSKSLSVDSIFSSPDRLFSDRLSSVVCLSVRPSVNFSYFRLLLQNHWANFNQTWHKASLGEGDSSLFK